MSTTKDVPKWHALGHWFDVCSCSIPCPCEFAQTPTNGECQGVMAYHINEGKFGETSLDGLNALALVTFKGNVWAGETKASVGIFFDEKANEKQREALQMIFSGKAGGYMSEFTKNLGEMRGVNFASIKFDVADDLSHWSAEIPGKVTARAEALTGPTTPPGKRVQTINPPGSEVGHGVVATWGTSLNDEVNVPEMRFEWKRSGRSSKHIPFDWGGP